jgi:hypothetical protein
MGELIGFCNLELSEFSMDFVGDFFREEAVMVQKFCEQL